MHSGSPSQQLSAHEGATNNNLDPEGWQICAGYSVSTSGYRGPADLQPFLSLVPVQGHIPMELEPPTTSVAASNQSHSTALMYQQFFHSDSLPGSPYPDAGPNQLSICPYSYPSSPVAQSQLEDESIPCTPSSQPSTPSRDPQGSRRDRRKVQNRAAQRAYRARQAERLKEGKIMIDGLLKKVQQLEQENCNLSWMFQTTKEELRKGEQQRKAKIGSTTPTDDRERATSQKQIDLEALLDGIF